MVFINRCLLHDSHVTLNSDNENYGHVTLATVYALIQSQLLHGLPIWASTYQTYLTKLRKLQNKAVKILAKAHPRERVSP